MLKNLIILLVIVTCVLASKESKKSKESKERENDRKFNSHLRRHGKKYDSLPEEVKLRRRNNYLKNLELIETHNKEGKHNFQLGSNEYSDRDNKRFVEEMCRAQLPASPRALPRPPSIYPKTNAALAAIDWRSKYTQPIVDQLGCGSCWAFSAASVIEAFNEIRGRGKVALSQQNIVDCDTADGGCNGGWPRVAMQYMKYNYGSKIAKSLSYGYTSGLTKVRGTCKTTPFIPLNYTSVFQFDLNGNYAALKQIISNYGPVAIAMYVSDFGYFQNYKSGIFYDPYCPGLGFCGTVNHAMVAVGYGKLTTGQEYFIIRNSWGTTWGEAGYMKMAMGNTCNVACYAMGVE